MQIISIRENPEYKDIAIKYFQQKWANENSLMVYDDCITSCVTAKSQIPQWYLLYKEQEIIGCAGLISNDFISRMDLTPWLCALYIEQNYRGNAYAKLLIDKIKQDTKKIGYEKLYLCTDHIGYYEKYGFEYIATGYHPWGNSSRIYMANV